jgi:hypothetical protein
VARSAEFVLRVVPVRGAGASDARRRVAGVLLRAANASPPLAPSAAGEGLPDVPRARSQADPASDDDHMTDP